MDDRLVAEHGASHRRGEREARTGGDVDDQRGIERALVTVAAGEHARVAGRFLIAANQDTGNLVVFRIDQESGRLTRTGVTAKVPSPVCVRFFQAGRG